MPVRPSFVRWLPWSPRALTFAALLSGLVAVTVWGQGPPAGQGAAAAANASAGAPANSTPPAAAAAPAPAGRNASAADNSSPPQPLATFVTISNTVSTAIATVLNGIGWSVVALLVLYTLRTQLQDLLKGLVKALPDRGITIDVGTFKLQLAERLVEGNDESSSLRSRSPFEVDEENPLDSWPTVKEVRPQLMVSVSDSVGKHWELYLGAKADAEQMRTDRDALKKACGSAGVTFVLLRPALLSYVRSLEKARFREAKQLAQLLDEHEALRSGIGALAPTDPVSEQDDCAVLHAVGVAYTQADRWQEAMVALEKITWSGAKPFYIPAGSVWLAANYNRLIDTLHTDALLDSDEVLTQVSAEIDRGQHLARAIELASDADWANLKVAAPKGYYLREVYKDIGDAAGTIADHLSTLSTRRRYLDQALGYLQRCVDTLLNEPPSPLDHNNLADLYRQLGDLARKEDGNVIEAARLYGLAHTHVALALSPPAKDAAPDPFYLNTSAVLLASEQRYRQALNELENYTAAHALLSGESQEQYQYVSNLMLAAKLEVADHQADDPRGVVHATRILGRAEQFLGLSTHQLPHDEVDELRTQVRDLLAFAYLQSPRGEARAKTVFEQVMVPAWNPSTTAELRTRVGYLTALVRIARHERRLSSLATADALRHKASREIQPVFALLKKLAVTSDVPGDIRKRNIGSWLDAVAVMQLLAEEKLCGHDAQAARALVRVAGEHLVQLRGEVSPSGPGHDHGQTLLLKRITARHALLAARLIAEEDPTLKSATTLALAEETLLGARGVRAELDCQAELEQGWLRLTSARFRRGDPEADFLEATSAFERAVACDAPSLRREAARSLAQAHALRASILRKSTKAAEQ